MILATAATVTDEALGVGASRIATGGAVDRHSELSPMPRAPDVGNFRFVSLFDRRECELIGKHG